MTERRHERFKGLHRLFERFIGVKTKAIARNGHKISKKKKKADLHVFTDILAGIYFNNIYTYLRLTVIAEIWLYNCITARAFS